MKYRFKTEEEMKSCFGVNWRETAFPGIGWNDIMDKYLGDEEILKNYDLTRSDEYYIFNLYDENVGNWTICMGMLKIYEDIPNYNPRKIIRNLD